MNFHFLPAWFGQFDKLYFVLNWLVLRYKLQPKLVAEAKQIQNVG